jgi:uncharacterized protein (TIRG00374 family)
MASDPPEDVPAEPDTTDPSVDGSPDPAGAEVELTDEQARQHLGVGGGIDRKKSIIGGIVAVVFLAIVFTRVIPQIGDYAEAAEYIQAMTTAAIVGLVAVVLWYLWVYGWPFVAATPGLRYKDGFVVNQSAFAVSNGIPAGGAFGLGLQYAQLTSYKATPTAATAAIGATGTWSVFVTLFLPVTGIAALAASGDDASKYTTAAILGIVGLAAVVGVFALILRSENNAVRIGGWADKAVNWILKRFKRPPADITAQVVKLRHDIVGLVRRRWHVITLSQIAVSWSQFAILYAALVGVSGQTGAPPVLVAYGCWAISQLGIMIPVTPGGLGTVDAVMIGLLTAFGVDNGIATAADLVWRAASYIPQIIIGLICIFYWRWDINHRRRKEAAAAAAA